MRVKQWMTAKVVTITKDKSVKEAAMLIRDNNIGGVIVVENDKPIGIITQGDINDRCAGEGKDPNTMKVEEAMVNTLISAHANDPISEVSRRMALAKIKKMPIVDDDKLIGILTRKDIARVINIMRKDMLEIDPEALM